MALDTISEAAGPVPRSAVFLFGSVMNGRAGCGAFSGPVVNFRFDPSNRIATEIDGGREFASPHEATEMHAGPGNSALFEFWITDEFHFDLRFSVDA